MAVVAEVLSQSGQVQLESLKRKLEQHPVFFALKSMTSLRRFMQAHVFAVWDFMSLVKRLQRDLTCVELPWQAPPDRAAARLINEIVLGEESDIGPDGAPISHLHLYLEAMREIGADTRCFDAFLIGLRGGMTPDEAMVAAGAPAHVRGFVGQTLRVATQASTIEVMANFFHGRENVIPRMFQALLDGWRVAPEKAPMFVFYLKRHIELDGDEHGPAAQRIVDSAIGGEPAREALAQEAAVAAIRARLALWDGVLASL